jgi:ABC-type transport system substrate-binding protein
VPKSSVFDLDFLAEEWAKIGARVQVKRISGHDPPDIAGCDFWVSGWTADYPDPDGFFRGLFRSGWPFYRDEEIDEMLAQARTLGDQDERLRLYHEVDRLWVAEHAGILPLSYGRAMLLRRPWVEGLWASPLSRAHLDEVVVRRGEREASAVELPDEPETLEREERVDAFDRL